MAGRCQDKIDNHFHLVGVWLKWGCNEGVSVLPPAGVGEERMGGCVLGEEEDADGGEGEDQGGQCPPGATGGVAAQAAAQSQGGGSNPEEAGCKSDNKSYETAVAAAEPLHRREGDGEEEEGGEGGEIEVTL